MENELIVQFMGEPHLVYLYKMNDGTYHLVHKSLPERIPFECNYAQDEFTEALEQFKDIIVVCCHDIFEGREIKHVSDYDQELNDADLMIDAIKEDK